MSAPSGSPLAAGIGIGWFVIIAGAAKGSIPVVIVGAVLAVFSWIRQRVSARGGIRL